MRKPEWPMPDDFEKATIRKVGTFWVADLGGAPKISTRFETALDNLSLYLRQKSEETEYTERREILAMNLTDLVYGNGAWDEVDEDTLLNYRLDADDIIKANPHLLSLGERERLEDQMPELRYE